MVVCLRLLDWIGGEGGQRWKRLDYYCVITNGAKLTRGLIAELSLTVPIVNTLAFLFTVVGEWWVESKVISRGMCMPLLSPGPPFLEARLWWLMVCA